MKTVRPTFPLKESRKQKKLWQSCNHNFVPHYEFDLSSDGYWEVGEKCKKCGFILKGLPSAQDMGSG